MLHLLLNISPFETISLLQYFCVSPELILVLISLLSLHKKDFIVFLPFQKKACTIRRINFTTPLYLCCQSDK